jgi:glycine oxidase
MLDTPMNPDIAVIGAGIIGASVAWRLVQAGVRVELIEAGRYGSEASWAGAGMLAPGGEMDRPTLWTDLALQSLDLYRGYVRELEQEGGCAIDYQEHGAVEIARSEDEWQALRLRAAAQRELGIASELVDRAQLCELAPLLEAEFTGALYFPRDALVDPRDLLRALRRACIERGVYIHENRRVSRIRATAAEVTLETAAGPLASGGAVLAAGAWSSRIPVVVDGTEHPLPASFPVRGHLLGYRLEPGSLGPILRHGPMYLLQRTGGYTVAGTSSERVGFRREIDPAIVNDIHHRVSALAPILQHAPAPDAWIGFRPATETETPVIQRVPGTRLWLCYGHYRNGILLAPATAERLQREIIASSEKGSTGPAGHP